MKRFIAVAIAFAFLGSTAALADGWYAGDAHYGHSRDQYRSEYLGYSTRSERHREQRYGGYHYHSGYYDNAYRHQDYGRYGIRHYHGGRYGYESRGGDDSFGRD